MKTKYIYCNQCWCKLENTKCGCLIGEYLEDYPYFCGNCNGHVGNAKTEKVEKVIKLIKKLKVKVPDGVASYSWN